MIDPFNITKFDRTSIELQEFWLFCIAVAGKKATTVSKAMESFLTEGDHRHYLPFDTVRRRIQTGTLRSELQRSRLGMYGKLERAFDETLDRFGDWPQFLESTTTETLEEIYGVGKKTSRFFILHSRPSNDIACLDVHIMRWLKAHGHTDLEKTPSGQTYDDLEQVFLKEAAHRGLTPADLDLRIWTNGATKR